MPSKALPTSSLFFQLLLCFEGETGAIAHGSEVPRSHANLLRKYGPGGMYGNWQVDEAVWIKLILD